MDNEAEPKVLSAEEQDMADGHRYVSQEFRDTQQAKAAAERKKSFQPKDGEADGPKAGKTFKKRDGDDKKGKGAPKPAPKTERIAKVLARAGLASRREVERLIGLGKIAVNGRILETPAVLVATSDVITVEGQVIGKAEPTRLWRYHKPVGLMTTHSDPQGRPTVFEKLPQPLPRVISVGRLDINSEGLLLLTNDGELARALEMPSTAWVRQYRVRALGNTSQTDLDRLKNGTTVEGVIYGPMEATLDKKQDKADGRANVWLTVAITEGKNREVRKVLESIGLKVNRLIRLAYGPFLLGNLEAGDVEEVGPRVIRELLSDKIDPRNLPVEGASQTRDAPKAYARDEAGAGRRSGGDRFGKSDARERPARERKVGDGPRVRREFEDRREFKDRDFDERPRFEGDGEARNRRPEAREDGPRSFTPRPDRPRPDRPTYDRSGYDRPRADGDKKLWTPRPERSGDDRPAFKKPYKPGGERSFGERSQGARSQGERSSFKPREDRGGERPAFKKPYASRDGAPPAGEAGAYERAKREFGGDRAERSERPRYQGTRPQGDRPQGDRPAFKKPYASRDGAERKPYGDRPSSDRPRSDRPQGERSSFRPREDRDGGDRKSYGDRGGFKPRDDRGGGERKSYGDKPRFDRSASGEGGYKGGGFKTERPRSDRPNSDRPAGGGYKASGPRSDRPGADRPRSEGGRPGGKPGGFKSGGFKPGGGRPSSGKPGGFDRKPRRED